MTFSEHPQHQDYLERCYALAKKGLSSVSPNPCVGAVLVYEDKIIGEGFHEVFGQDHAEVNCLNSVKPEDRQYIPKSTMYVSLEPCSHYGKTPPCTKAIIEAKIGKVVIGCHDPHILVAGDGVEGLEKAGIEVVISEDKASALDSNRYFMYSQILERPHITLKWAQTRNGFLGRQGVRTKISNELSDILVHTWRSETDAILVGSRTALIDNPRLTTRLVDGNSPIRILVDREAIVPRTHQIYSDEAPTWTFSMSLPQNDGIRRTFQLPRDKEHHLRSILSQLHKEGIQRVFVEGGARMFRTFIEQGYWDEARVITSPLTIEQGVKAPSLTGSSFRKYQLGTDSVEIINNDDTRRMVLERMNRMD